MESLTPEVAPFGIRTMLVEPGFFRTELLTPESTSYAEPSIDDYAERTKQTVDRLERHERPAGRRPRQARRRAGPARRPGRAAAALGRRRRRRRAPSSRRPTTCSPRPTPTATCPRRSPTTTPPPDPADPQAQRHRLPGHQGDQPVAERLPERGWARAGSRPAIARRVLVVWQTIVGRVLDAHHRRGAGREPGRARRREQAAGHHRVGVGAPQRRSTRSGLRAPVALTTAYRTRSPRCSGSDPATTDTWTNKKLDLRRPGR